MNNSYWTLHARYRLKNETTSRNGTTSTKYDDFNDVMHAFTGFCGGAVFAAIVVETSYRPDGTEDNRIICSYTYDGQAGGEIKF